MNFSHVISFTSVASGQLLAVRHTLKQPQKIDAKEEKAAFGDASSSILILNCLKQ